jgi:TrmH family RNA methyltransferase
MEITSAANPKIKLIRKLREKKERQATGLCYIEGLRIVIEALDKNAGVKSLIISHDLLHSERGQEVVKKAIQQGVEIVEVSLGVFESIALKENPQGIAAIVSQNWSTLSNIKIPEIGLWTALDSVADPGNLGTIMRTMDAVGGRGIILIGQCVDAYDPSSLRASMGAVFSLEIIKTDQAEFVEWKKKNKVKLIGTSDKASTPYTDVQYPGDLILLMGSERQGMHPELEAICDFKVRIPMEGSSDSLNLSIANAIVLYEIYHQQHLG